MFFRKYKSGIYQEIVSVKFYKKEINRKEFFIQKLNSCGFFCFMLILIRQKQIF